MIFKWLLLSKSVFILSNKVTHISTSLNRCRLQHFGASLQVNIIMRSKQEFSITTNSKLLTNPVIFLVYLLFFLINL